MATIPASYYSSQVASADGVRPSVSEGTVRRGIGHVSKTFYAATAAARKHWCPMGPLQTTVTLTVVQRIEKKFARYGRDGVINGIELLDLRDDLSELEGQARHADHCTRYAQTVQRQTDTPRYIGTLAAKAGYPDPQEAA